MYNRYAPVKLSPEKTLEKYHEALYENAKLQAKLDEIKQWAKNEVMFTANTTGMAESVAYTRAQLQVLQIIRGDE